MKIIKFKDEAILDKCMNLINELGLIISNNKIEIDDESAKKFIDKLKKEMSTLGVIEEKNCKILVIGEKSVEGIKNNKHPTFDEMNKAISKAVKNLPTRKEMDSAIKDAIKDLPTRKEMNSAIKDAIKDLPTRDEMNNAIKKAINEAPFVTKDEFNVRFSALELEIQSLKKLIIDKLG